MTSINLHQFITRTTTKHQRIKRDWFIVKHNGSSGAVNLGSVTFPKSMVGRRVMFKVIEVPDFRESLEKKG